MKYFELLNDVKFSGRWFLGNFKEQINFWKFLKPEEIRDYPQNIVFTMRENGIPLDFTFADFELPIVNERTSKLFNSDDVQLIPITIDGLKSNNKYYIVVIKKEVECVDESKSVFEKFQENDPIRPDKAGKYSGIFKLNIHTKNITNENIFRIKNFNVAIIVNENLKKEFEKLLISGVKFKKVG